MADPIISGENIHTNAIFQANKAKPVFLSVVVNLVLSTDTTDLGVFETKVLCMIFGPVRAGHDSRIRSNSELYEVLNDINVVHRINTQRLPFLGLVVRM